jgi:hypothetical protein
MLVLMALLLAAPQEPDAISPPELARLLSRVAEEAAVFQQNMPKALSQETLEQNTIMPPSRFRPRIGTAAVAVLKPRLQVREIVSEYTVGTLKESASNNIVEFRQVVSVDGRAVQSVENARHALSLGMQSQDDRLRKRMLEDFAKNGLVDVATDYGLILLAFTKRGMENMHFTTAGESRVGTDEAVVLLWNQTSSAGGELEFRGRQATRRALQGTLWVRKSDGLPLRVQAWAQHADRGHVIRDQATVEYTPSHHGFLSPVSVVHRHEVDGQVITRNLYRYEPFKLFSSDAEIKFTEIPDAPAPAKK